MIKRNFIIIILLFFLKIFTIKCDDNYCFIEFNFNDPKRSKGETIDKKKSTLEIIKNKSLEEIFNDSKDKLEGMENVKLADYDFLGIVVFVNTTISGDNFFYNKENADSVYTIFNNNKIKDYKIYKDLDELKTKKNNYKGKCVCFYYGYKDFYNLEEIKKGVTINGVDNSFTFNNKLKIVDYFNTIEKKDFIHNVFIEDFQKKINYDFNKTNKYDNEEITIDKKKFPNTVTNLSDLKDLGAIFDFKIWRDDKDNKLGIIGELHCNFKRRFKIKFTPPTGYEVVNIFKNEINTEIAIDSFHLEYSIFRNIMNYLNKEIIDKKHDEIKNNEGINVQTFGQDEIFYKYDKTKDIDFDNIGLDARKIIISGIGNDDNQLKKELNKKEDLDDFLCFKKDEDISVEFQLGEYSEILKTTFIEVKLEPTKDYVLCDRIPKKKILIPLKISDINSIKGKPDFDKKLAKMIKEEFIKFLRKQGIKSETIGEINLKIPEELFDLLEKDYDGKITKVEQIEDCSRVIIQFNDNAVGRFCKKEGEADPAPFDPDTDEKYKDNPNEPIVTINHQDKKDDITDHKISKELGCCAKCMSKCCCCNKSNRKRSNSI